jgi:hypothetical protein
MTLIWIIGAAVAAIGGILVGRGLLGRGTAGAPRCRGCGHLVTAAQAEGGVSPDERCPECGRELAGAGITTRRVRRRMVAAGVLVIGVGLGGAAAWPSPAWRAARLPTWWLLRVERPLASPAGGGLLLEALARRRADPVVNLSDGELGALVQEYIARVRAGDTASLDPEGLDPWRRLVEEAVVAGLVDTPDVALVHRHWTSLRFSASPLPPTQLDLSWGIGGNQGTTGRPRGANMNAMRSVLVEPSDVRVDGVSVVGPDWSWSGATSPDLAWTGRSRGFTAWTDAGDEPLAAGPHEVELDLVHRAGVHTWTETLTTTVIVPSWPPPDFPAVDPATLQHVPVVCRVMTLAEFAATGDPRSMFAGADARRWLDFLDPDIRLLVVVATLDPRVVGFDGRFLEIDLVLGDGRVVRLHESLAAGGRGPRSSSRMAASSDASMIMEFVYRMPADAAGVLRDLPATVDVILPIGRMRIRVPRADLPPPPGPGESEMIEGWIPAPARGRVRLSGITVRGPWGEDGEADADADAEADADEGGGGGRDGPP